MLTLKVVKQYLHKNRNPTRAEKVKAYLYSDFYHYGLSKREYKTFYKQYKDDIKSLTKTPALSIVKRLWNQPSHEEKNIALTILNLHKKELDISDMPTIEKMMRECKGWALLDNLIIPIMPVIIEKDQIAYRYLKKWIKDDDFWARRSALLAQLLFFRKGAGGDKNLFFEFAKSQFDESWIDETYKYKEKNKRAKFFIRKAIGWTLREMSQKDPKAVVKFLKENKDKMASLTFREGSRKLPEKYKKKL